MENSWQSNMLNPAFTPEQGYVLIPVLGGTGVNVGSNSLSVDKLFYSNPNGSGLVSFLDVDIDKSILLNSISDNNNVYADFSTTIFGVGFYSDSNIFWTFGSNLKAGSSVSLPRGIFEFAKLSRSDNTYDLQGLNASLNCYLENYVGASMKIGDFNVGAKVKVLLGILDASVQFDDMTVVLDGSEWSITSNGQFAATAAGLYLSDELSDFSFDNIEYSPEFKTSGFGLGVDLGGSYDVLDDLTVSMSVTDFGFIRWSGESTVAAQSSGSYIYKGVNFSDSDADVDAFDVDDILQFENANSDNRTKSLSTTFNAAGEYRLADDKVAAGLLYSARLRSGYTQHEVTAVASLRPANWVTANVSYSAISSTVGAALNLHPSWINLFLGMDYVTSVLSVTPQYIPMSAKNINFYFGVGIPILKD